MPARLYDALDNWFNGVNNSASADQLPPATSPRGRNTTLKLIGDTGTARMGKRRGALTLNATPVTGSPAVAGFQFRKKSGTKYNLLASDTGRLDLLNTDGTTTVINATGFTSGAHYPTFQVANDLCFITNDVDQKKYDGSTLTAFGITRPAAPGAVVGAAGTPNGAYDIALTYYNSLTGHESSLSNFTTVNPVNQKITVTWGAPADPQVNYVRVYIRKQTLGPNAFRAVVGATPAPDATIGGYLTSQLTTSLDISDAQIQALILLAPSTSENDPPPTGAQYACWHNNRMFVADSGNIYYSEIRSNTPYPEAFNPSNFEAVNPNDGDSIVALFSQWGRLFIFKRFSLWQIEGSDPNSWTVSLVSPSHGAASQRSICAAEGVLYWWSAVNGPTAMSSGGLPVNIGKQYLFETVDADHSNHLQAALVCAVVDENQQNILWAFPEVGQSRNTCIIPFNYRASRFESDCWNPFDIYSMWQVETADHFKSVYMGNYGGQVFDWWRAGNDGVPVGSTTHGSVTAATSTTLTDSTATFTTAGGGLKERYVYAITVNRTSMQRRRITGNTGTVLTVSPAWDTTPNTFYTYVVGGIDFQLDTPWVSSGDIFLKKRYELFFSQLATTDLGVTVDVDFFRNFDDTAPFKTITLTLAATGGVWATPAGPDPTDVGIWDTTTWGDSTQTLTKTRLGFVAKAWRARIRNCAADADITVYKVAAQSVPLGIHN